MVAGLFSKGLLLLGLCAGLGATKDDSKPLYKNPNAAVDDRVDDLLSRMTIEDKKAQLIQGTIYLDHPLFSLLTTYNTHRRHHQLDGRHDR